MGEFVCRVADANGRVFSHVEAAGTLAEARQKLVDRGLYVYSVETRSGIMSGMRRQRGRTVGGTDFLILNQQFNTLIKAGLPILRAFDLLADRASSPEVAAGHFADSRSSSRREVAVRGGHRSRRLLESVFDRDSCGRKVRQLGRRAGLLHRVSEGQHRRSEENSGDVDLPGAVGHRRRGHRHIFGHGGDPQIRAAISRLTCDLPTPTQILIALTVDYRYVFIAGIVAVGLLIVGYTFGREPMTAASRSTD